ncbi:GNAT family N-acetyltransferase [Rhodobium gokarnense]|uniref:GNAT superfamily acetyltransferase n=1 Tax=Rhodobium gokarnense TaxID=364296 RepID=A0ABT3H9G0_9HYPH|nr:GNAT family N-acetyltransferase [Rhodobium gokarnense]MCW2307023.1 putative GNAT superfamily acetyltransferase [Rhodobium gokarnense]
MGLVGVRHRGRVRTAGTMASRIRDIATADADIHAALLALNNDHSRETSLLTAAAWHDLVSDAFLAGYIPPSSGFLIAFDERAGYENPNFAWFADRFPRFVYVDRIVVSAGQKGRALGRQMYEELFRRARTADRTVIGCEVNLEPPNPGSAAFHAKLGFEEAGQAHLSNRGKTVRYLVRRL